MIIKMLVGLAAVLLVTMSLAAGMFERVGDFRIQREPIQLGTWLEAVEICTLKIGGRLCNAAEWTAACQANIIKAREPEWVSDVGPNVASGRDGFAGLVMHQTKYSCGQGTWVDLNSFRAIRCCRSN